MLNGLLKEELGFQGFVVSDWGGQHSGVASALAGLDMAMPNAKGFWEGNMTIAIANGTFPESRLDDMATRYVGTAFGPIWLVVEGLRGELLTSEVESSQLGTSWDRTLETLMSRVSVCRMTSLRLTLLLSDMRQQERTLCSSK